MCREPFELESLRYLNFNVVIFLTETNIKLISG